MDEFAQSRGDDDLFDDEIVPIERAAEPSGTIAEQVQKLQPDDTASAVTQQQQQPAVEPPFPGFRGRGRGRGRARGSNGTSRGGGLAESRFAPKQSTPVVLPPKPARAENEESEVKSGEDGSPNTQPQEDEKGEPLSNIPTGPSAGSKPPAVRGDRTATGGLKKPKLTEEELSAKLAAAKERSQTVAAAHARAQADAENFAERERVAQRKRKEEAAERRALEGERERNRERKLKAVGGREWDAEKNEDDFRAPRYGDRARRGGQQQQQSDQDLSMYEWKDDRGRGTGRGRGRGRGGPGRGRGGRAVFETRNGSESDQRQSNPPKEEDFPSLPASNTSKQDSSRGTSRPQQTRLVSDSAPSGASWADQVESSEAAAKA